MLYGIKATFNVSGYSYAAPFNCIAQNLKLDFRKPPALVLQIICLIRK
jgi:hypothetical protein